MNINNLAEKYINRGIAWLMKFLDTYQGMTSIDRIEEELTEEQLEEFYQVINKDERVLTSFINDKELTIIFKK